MSLDRYFVIDSTLREGEQFINAQFSSEQKVRIAHGLDEFGAEYLELTSPMASPGSLEDLRTIARLGLKSRILTHIRCHKGDAAIALDTGVDGVDVVIGTSSKLRQFSHGKSIDEIIDLAAEVLTWIRVQAPNIELRFSTEDSFRSEEMTLGDVKRTAQRLLVIHDASGQLRLAVQTLPDWSDSSLLKDAREIVEPHLDAVCGLRLHRRFR